MEHLLREIRSRLVSALANDGWKPRGRKLMKVYGDDLYTVLHPRRHSPQADSVDVYLTIVSRRVAALLFDDEPRHPVSQWWHGLLCVSLFKRHQQRRYTGHPAIDEVRFPSDLGWRLRGDDDETSADCEFDEEAVLIDAVEFHTLDLLPEFDRRVAGGLSGLLGWTLGCWAHRFLEDPLGSEVEPLLGTLVSMDRPIGWEANVLAALHVLGRIGDARRLFACWGEGGLWPGPLRKAIGSNT